jgi:hypothetical protein
LVNQVLGGVPNPAGADGGGEMLSLMIAAQLHKNRNGMKLILNTQVFIRRKRNQLINMN